MNAENEIFLSQATLIKQGASLLDSRANAIELIAKQRVHSQKATEERCNTIDIFTVRSIRLFRDTLTYLSKEMSRNEVENHFFLLPHVRTLLDIYARFLYLQINCPNESRQALVCLSYQLLLSKTLNSEPMYQEILALNKNFLNTETFSYPDSVRDFSFGWTVKKGLAFPNREELLTEENIKGSSVYSADVFGAKKTYDIYSYFSELIHGNPYYYLGKPHNERFLGGCNLCINVIFLIGINR